MCIRDRYEALVASGLEEDRESAQLYFNLGNAYFRDHQLGKAILNYERAHLLSPGDSDIRHNLRYANNYTEDRITPASNLFLTNWFNGVRDLYSSNTWARLAVIFFVLFIACVALFLFVRVISVRDVYKRQEKSAPPRVHPRYPLKTLLFGPSYRRVVHMSRRGLP